jgi:hypothetical protein
MIDKARIHITTDDFDSNLVVSGVLVEIFIPENRISMAPKTLMGSNAYRVMHLPDGQEINLNT